jgi:hypothetical protein
LIEEEKQGKSIALRSLLSKMKMMKPQTQTGKVLATAVAAAVMLKKVLNTKKIL